MTKLNAMKIATSSLSATGLGLLVVSLGVGGAGCGTTSNGGTGGDGGGGGPADGASSGDVGTGQDAPGTDGEGTSDSGGGDGSSADGSSGDGGNPEPAGAVNLGTAGNYVILAKSGISTVPASVVTGNLGLSPAAASYITGFSLTADSTNVFATSPQVTGKVYASDYAAPTPSNLTTAVSDMQLAFTDAAGRAPGVTELGAGNIGGKTLTAGVYKWSTGLLIPTDVTLTGSATDVWILQIAQNLTVSNAAKVVLSGGAVPANVFWQVSGMASLGTTSQLEGTVMCQTSITLDTGASVHGRLLAQTAVSIDKSTVVQP